MNDAETHVKLAIEKMQGAADEYGKKRDAVVGDLTIMAVEQTIEAPSRSSESTSASILGRACGEDTMDEGEVPKGLEGLGLAVGRLWRARLRGRRWSKGEEGT